MRRDARPVALVRPVAIPLVALLTWLGLGLGSGLGLGLGRPGRTSRRQPPSPDPNPNPKPKPAPNKAGHFDRNASDVHEFILPDGTTFWAQG